MVVDCVLPRCAAQEVKSNGRSLGCSVFVATSAGNGRTLSASGTSAGLVNYRDGYGYLIQCAEPVDAKAIAKLHGQSGNVPI